MSELELSIFISKTADGKQDYLQILTPDQLTVNIVLVGKVTLEDLRDVRKMK